MNCKTNPDPGKRKTQPSITPDRQDITAYTPLCARRWRSPLCMLGGGLPCCVLVAGGPALATNASSSCSAAAALRWPQTPPPCACRRPCTGHIRLFLVLVSGGPALATDVSSSCSSAAASRASDERRRRPHAPPRNRRRPPGGAFPVLQIDASASRSSEAHWRSHPCFALVDGLGAPSPL